MPPETATKYIIYFPRIVKIDLNLHEISRFNAIIEFWIKVI